MEIQRIDPEEAKRLLDSDEGYAYLDVRSRDEFRAGHAPGAVNIPLLDNNPAGPGLLPNSHFLQEVEESFGKDAKIIAACLRGGRSLKAARLLVGNGYTHVVDMRGGYDGETDREGNVTFPGWSRRDLPTTTDE